MFLGGMCQAASGEVQVCVCPGGATSQQSCDSAGAWGACACTPTRVGLECDEASPCGPGLECVEFYESGQGHCFAPCETSDAGLTQSTCESGYMCVGTGEGRGICAESCKPYGAASENGCDAPGRNDCLPHRSESVGICAPSGDVLLGGPCNQSTECEAGTQCAPGEGICRPRCYAFSGEAGCGEGAVCGYSYPWDGVCTAVVAEPRLPPFEACETEGLWCDDNTRCVVIDAEANKICVSFCRVAEGDEDCPTGAECLEQFSGATLGYCSPTSASNCLLSDWSDWGACDVSCGSGDQSRTRTVVREAQPGGAACGPVTETRPCEGLPCYMVNFQFLERVGAPGFGLAVKNQTIAIGTSIILHEGDNKWRMRTDGTIVLEDNPMFGLALASSIGDCACYRPRYLMVTWSGSAMGIMAPAV